MTEPFIGEIRIFGFNFVPADGWLQCNGQIVAIQTYQTLYSVIGAVFGGDGRNTFAVPDLRGRVPLGFGQAGTGTTYPFSQAAGVETVPLTVNNLPSHTHGLAATLTEADTDIPTGAALANARSNTYVKPDSNPALNTAFMIGSVGLTGNSIPVENRQPYLAMNFCIAFDGVYPQRQ